MRELGYPSRLHPFSAPDKPNPQPSRAGEPGVQVADATLLSRRKLRPAPGSLGGALAARLPVQSRPVPSTPRARATHHSRASSSSEAPAQRSPNQINSASGKLTNKKHLPAPAGRRAPRGSREGRGRKVGGAECTLRLLRREGRGRALRGRGLVLKPASQPLTPERVWLLGDKSALQA